MEERDPDLDWGEVFHISTDREYKWKEVEEEDNKDRVEVHSKRGMVDMNGKEELTNR